MISTKRVVMVLAIGLTLGSVGPVVGSADRDDDHLEARSSAPESWINW
jgi:hypothetical protein